MPLTDAERDAFLARTRLGMFSSLRADGSPVTVPVWYEHDGAAVRLFAGSTSGKVARLRRDPRATLLVPNDVGEPEMWVAFDGRCTIDTDADAALALAERLAQRYWDMSDAAKQREVASWRGGIVTVAMAVESVRSSKG
jgi:PPOX class probable F420-dependent enzyme